MKYLRNYYLSGIIPCFILLIWLSCGDPVQPEFNIPPSIENGKEVYTSGTLEYGASYLMYLDVNGTEPFNYQWYFNDIVLTGKTDDSLPFASLAFSDTGSYRCIVSNEFGKDTSLPSLIQIEIADSTAPVILAVHTPNTCVIGFAYYIYTEAVGSDTLKYQWYKNDAEIIGATKDTLPFSPLQYADNGYYRCMVRNDYGSDTCLPELIQVEITDSTPPEILAIITPDTMAVGLNYYFYAQAVGGDTLKYQWYKNSAEITGATRDTLPFSPLQYADNGYYKCIVTNDYGSDSSLPELIQLEIADSTPPEIQAIITADTLAVGLNYYIHVQAVGSDTLKYQWYKNGAAITTATRDTLPFSPFQSSDIGYYHCIVTNDFGYDSSKICTLSVVIKKPPIVSIIPDQTIKKGTAFTVINLDDHVNDSDNTNAEITWTVSPTTKITITISTDRKATITVDSVGWIGSETVTFTAKDPDGLSDTTSTVFAVTDNDPPIVSDIPDDSIAEGNNFTVINLDDYVNDSDNTDEQIIWTASPATNLTVSIVSRQATIAVIDSEWNESETVTFTATDPTGLSNSDNAVFKVSAVNDPPVISDISNESIAEGGSFTIINLDDHVEDADNNDNEMTWTTPTTTNITVTIDANRQATIKVINSEWNGSEEVLFTVKDPGNLNDTNYVTFTVSGEDDPPIVSDIPGESVAEGTNFTVINLDDYVNDSDNTDEQITWTASATTNLTVSIVDRQATITVVDTEWNESEIVTFTAKDPTNLSNSDNATFTVTAVNDPPVIDGQSTLTINEDGSQIIAMSDLTIIDPDNSTFTGPVLSSGPNYTFSGNTVTPTSNYNGTLSVPVTVGDGTNTSAPFSVSITVDPVNDAPIITGPSNLSTPEDTYLPITLATLSVTDIDNTYPTGFDLTIFGGSNYTVNGDGIDPQSNYAGALTVPVQVNDGTDNSNVHNISVNVTSVNDAPTISITSIVPSTKIISYGNKATINTNFSDVDNNLKELDYIIDGVVVLNTSITSQTSYSFDWYPPFGPHLCRAYNVTAIITDDDLATGTSDNPNPEQITVTGTLESDTLSAQMILDVNGSPALLSQYIQINNGRITDLDFGDADITIIPPEIDNLTEVRYFNFSSNHNIEVLPPEVFTLTKIYDFSITMNKITAIPSAIGNLVNIVSLYINENQLTSLPAEIGLLTKLDYLFAGGNDITTLPDEITNVHPSVCDFGYNKLSRAALSNNVETWLDSTDIDWESTQSIK